MSVLMRNLLAAGSIFLVCSCAAGTKPSSSASVTKPPDGNANLASAFARQNECYNAWSQLVSDWEKNGGGFKKSLLATKRQIATDHVSAFAAIVRGVWSAQNGEKISGDKFGSWPISSADTTVVIAKPNDAISKTLDQYLPHGCGAFAWLYPVIWDRVHVEGGMRAMHFAEMPDGIVWDSYNTPRWVVYWLFVRAK